MRLPESLRVTNLCASAWPMRNCVETLSQAVIAWILPEQRWIKKDAEEIAGGVVSNRSAEAFSIACCAHLIAGIVAIKLGGGGVPGRAHIVQRIGGAFNEHVEFIRG